MKLTSIILTVLLAVYVTCIFATDIMLKKQYEKMDKHDMYWNYTKVEERPFKHVKITGGNLCQIVFEPSARSSVRILNYWNRYFDGRVKTTVKNDTLFLGITDKFSSLSEKNWMSSRILIRIFSPQLLSVDGWNTNLEISKFKQRKLQITLAGRSQLEVESFLSSFDSLFITQKDTSKISFEMSPDLNGSHAMQLNALQAHIQGYSILDVGHFQIHSLQYTIEDTSAIIFSGGTLKAMKK